MKKTKEKVFWGSLMLSIVYVGLYSLWMSDMCSSGGILGSKCDDILTTIETAFVPILPFFFFSLITYKLRDEVFRTWLHFACWWIPVSFLLTLSVSGGGGGFGMHSFGGEDVAMILSVFFFFVSLVVIIIRSLTLRGK